MAIKLFVLLALALIQPLFAPNQAQAQVGPDLGVASNFEQGWFPGKLEMSKTLPVLDFRDAMRWRNVEQYDGSYVFRDTMALYPRAFDQAGAKMSLTVDSFHPAYDNSMAPYTREGQAAFGRFAAAAVAKFPNIHSIEVGNQMNREFGAAGPGWDGNIQLRARTYTGLLKATAEAVRAVRPDVKILGGAAHSMPLPWFDEIFSEGGAAYMDAIVLHPYAIAPEMLRRNIALLRAIPAAADMPIEITEWGTLSAEGAPAYLMRGYCQFALSGVTRFIWYPLGPRGDGMIPLLDNNGITNVGRAYQVAQDNFAGKSAIDIAPDPFTYGCAFGDNAVVIWGAPRSVDVSDGVQVFSADGKLLDPENLMLDRDFPIVLLSDQLIRLGQEVTLGAHGIIADSYDQFAYPVAGQDAGPFMLYAQHGEEIAPLELRPGQERGGVPWSPYLGNPLSGQGRANPGWISPALIYDGSTVGEPLAIVQRYRAEHTTPAKLMIDIAPSENTQDGVILQVRQDGVVLLEQLVMTPQIINLPLKLTEGQDTEVVISPGETATGDYSLLRVRYSEVK